MSLILKNNETVLFIKTQALLFEFHEKNIKLKNDNESWMVMFVIKKNVIFIQIGKTTCTLNKILSGMS